MGSLWATADKMWPERRNREAIIGRLLFPIFDVDNADAVTVNAKVVSGLALPAVASIATFYTAPSLAQISTLTLCNSSASTTHEVDIYLVESGGLTNTHALIFRDRLSPKETVNIEGPWFLNAGDMIRVNMDDASGECNLRSDGLEYSAQPEGLSIKVLNGVTLGGSLTSLYTCPSSGVVHALLLAATLCNADASAAQATAVHLVPSGGTPTVPDSLVFSETLQKQETAVYNGHQIIRPGATVQALSTVSANVAIRLSIVEFLTTTSH